MPRSHTLLWASLVYVAPFVSTVAQQPPAQSIQLERVANKLGVKLLPSAPPELEPGHSVTTSLADPAKLSPYGIKGMHEGARVTITCVAPGQLRVDADEIEPVEQKGVVTLRLNADGTLTRVPDRPAGQRRPPASIPE